MKYPIQNDGTICWRDRADYIPQKWAALDKAYPEAFITTTRLKSTLEMLEAGMMNPSDMEEWMGEVADDIQLAKDNESLVNEKTESAELAVVNAAQITNIGAGLGMVLKQFDCGQGLNQLVCKPETKDTDLGMAVTVLMGLKDFSEFALGDAINELKKRGHENAVNQICSVLNREGDYVVMHGYSKTAEIFPPGTRDLKGLSFSHYSECGRAKYDPDPEKNKAKAHEVARIASEQGLNTSQTRAEVKRAQGKEIEPTELNKPKWQWLVIEDCASGRMYLTDREPEGGDGKWAIDLFDHVFAEAHGEKLHAWMPIIKQAAKPIEPKPETEDEVLLVVEK